VVQFRLRQDRAHTFKKEVWMTEIPKGEWESFSVAFEVPLGVNAGRLAVKEVSIPVSW
jgi:hypothetical protein